MWRRPLDAGGDTDADKDDRRYVLGMDWLTAIGLPVGGIIDSPRNADTWHEAG